MKKRYAMVSPKRLEKLSKNQQDDLLVDLVNAFQLIKDPNEVILFIGDLFTRAEVSYCAKRLRIAKLLLAGETYETIEKELHTSHATVSKVAAWLREKGDGFRQIVQKLPKPHDNLWSETRAKWIKIMRQHPRFFWPNPILKDLSKEHSHNQKIKLQQLREVLQYKQKLHRQIEASYHKSSKTKIHVIKYSTT